MVFDHTYYVWLTIMFLFFKNFCQRISPESCLGLDMKSIDSYKVGETLREIDGEIPDLLPCGYIIGNVESIVVRLKGNKFCGN